MNLQGFSCKTAVSCLIAKNTYKEKNTLGRIYFWANREALGSSSPLGLWPGRWRGRGWQGRAGPTCLVRSGKGHRARSNDSGKMRRPPLLNGKKSSSDVGLGGRFSEANSRHGGAEESGERQDEEGSARELGGVRIQAREAFGSRFLPDRSGSSGDHGTWRPWRRSSMGGGAARFLQGGEVRDTGKRKGRGMRIKRRW